VPRFPGVGLDTESDSIYFMTNVKPKITTGIYGYGGSPSVYTVENTTNWNNITEDFIFSADTVSWYRNNTTKGSQFGTAS
jgi:hypothetical protein